MMSGRFLLQSRNSSPIALSVTAFSRIGLSTSLPRLRYGAAPSRLGVRVGKPIRAVFVNGLCLREDAECTILRNDAHEATFAASQLDALLTPLGPPLYEPLLLPLSVHLAATLPSLAAAYPSHPPTPHLILGE